MPIRRCLALVAASTWACQSPASSSPPLASSVPVAVTSATASVDTAEPKPPPAAEPRFRDELCTGADLDLDRALADRACELQSKDPRLVSITHDASGGIRGGKLVYTLSPRELHAGTGAAVEIQVAIKNVGADAAEIALVVARDRTFVITAVPVSPLQPEQGGQLVSSPNMRFGPQEARYAYARIPPDGVAHAVYAGKATTTRTEHLESTGGPAPWVVKPYPFAVGTYTLTIRPPWGGEDVSTSARLVVSP
jgi:hypothetical protein